jgi:hypothetical protein
LIEGMNVSFAQAYTVEMAEGHPGNGEIDEAQTVFHAWTV